MSTPTTATRELPPAKSARSHPRAAADGEVLEQPARDGGGAAHRTARRRRSWLHTGDLGYLDEDGYVFIVDRKKDLIKTSGYQVWPREIEEVIAAHPAVAEVGVAGIPDRSRAKSAKAWVVLEPAQHATEAEVRASAASGSRPTRCPRTVEFRTELPKTMVGKVLRRALADEERTAAGQRRLNPAAPVRPRPSP